MRKFVIFALNGDVNCFLHVLLTVLDMDKKGYQVRLVIAGSATCLTRNPDEHGVLLASLFRSVKERGLIDDIRLSCEVTSNGRDAVEVTDRPGMADYLADGYQIITF